MVAEALLDNLCEHGLGELYMLHRGSTQPFLGQLVQDKGRLFLKDRGLFDGLTRKQLEPCWQSGIVGALTHEEGLPWKSLTFVGLDHCQLERDRSDFEAPVAGDSPSDRELAEFRGSVYRGFQLMLEHRRLPVVIFRGLKLHSKELGLAVCDLRVSAIPPAALDEFHGRLVESVALFKIAELPSVLSDEDFADLLDNDD